MVNNEDKPPVKVEINLLETGIWGASYEVLEWRDGHVLIHTLFEDTLGYSQYHYEGWVSEIMPTRYRFDPLILSLLQERETTNQDTRTGPGWLFWGAAALGGYSALSALISLFF